MEVDTDLPTSSGTRTPAGGEEGWLKGTLATFERMTTEGWSQDVRFVEIKTQEGLMCVGSSFSSRPSFVRSPLTLYPSSLLSDPRYSPGSILQLLPSNSPASVAQFLNLQAHLPPPTQQLLFTPASSASALGSISSPTQSTAEPHHNLPMTLLELLRDHLDLSAVPRRSFFQWMRCFTTDEREVERLDEFLHLEQGGVSLAYHPFDPDTSFQI